MTLEIVLWPLHTCTYMHPYTQEHAHTCICPHATEWDRTGDCGWSSSVTWTCGHILLQYGNRTEYHLKLAVSPLIPW